MARMPARSTPLASTDEKKTSTDGIDASTDEKNASRNKKKIIK